MPRVPSRRSSSSSVRTELASIGARPRKSLGQHFLHDRMIADRIVGLLEPHAGDAVFEIGPGLGILTERLVALPNRLTLIELDDALAERAERRYGRLAHVRVVRGDAARVDWENLLTTDAVVIGNLPYNAATAILQRILQDRCRIRRVVAMVQKEVAERMVALPDTEHYGGLSVLTQFDCTPRIAFTVAPGAFSPPPKVSSAVVILAPCGEPPVAVRSEQRFRRLVRGVFQHRRKQLANALRGVVAEPRELLVRLGVDATRRPETLSLAEFALLERESADA